VYSDRVSSSKKSDIFARLHVATGEDEAQEGIVSSSGESSVRVHITGVSKAADTSGNNSVFARLGGKQPTLSGDVTLTKEIKSILKNTQRSVVSGVTKNSPIVKAKRVAASTVPQQKVMLVHKVPLKRCDDEDDSMDDLESDEEELVFSGESEDFEMGAAEKIVKFASTAEVREIAPESSFKNRHGKNFANNIKSRLGIGMFSQELLNRNQLIFNLIFSIQTSCHQEDLQPKGIALKETTGSPQPGKGQDHTYAQRRADDPPGHAARPQEARK